VRLERFFTNQLSASGVKTSLIEITNKMEFWADIKQFDVINQVILDINPPNLFSVNGSFSKLNKEFSNATNYQKFRMWFRSKTGLKFTKEEFEEPIDLLSKGQGDYKVVGQEKGEKKILTSHQNQYIQILEDELSSESTENIEKAIDDADK